MTGDALTQWQQGGGGLTALPPLQRATVAFLWQYRESKATRDAYQRDIRDFLAWCQQQQVDPLAAGREDLTRYSAWLSQTPSRRTGRPLAASTVNRHQACLSSWYEYLTAEGLTRANPVQRVRRARIDRQQTTTQSLSKDEVGRLVAAAAKDKVFGGLVGYALAYFLAVTGARTTETCNLRIEHLGTSDGVRTARLYMKGGKQRVRALPPTLAQALDSVIGDRTAGPVFLARGEPINRRQLYKFVRRAAYAAGIATWERISPHSLRHSWVTLTKQAGASLEDRQFALGHADPRTTQRYDHTDGWIQRDPAWRITQLLFEQGAL